MDNYQGKNLDRYQEEIRKAAAKGVKDLNLNGNITPTLSHGSHVGRTLPKSTGSTSYATSNGNLATRTPNPIVSSVSSSVQSGISVSAAAAKFESLQRLNQINASNINASKTQAETLFQNEATQKDNTGSHFPTFAYKRRQKYFFQRRALQEAFQIDISQCEHKHNKFIALISKLMCLRGIAYIWPWGSPRLMK